VDDTAVAVKFYLLRNSLERGWSFDAGVVVIDGIGAPYNESMK